MTGGQAAAQSLKRQGLEVIFGLPGVQLDWLFDGLYDVQDSIKIYHTRNEQATSYMADGYACSTRPPASRPPTRRTRRFCASLDRSCPTTSKRARVSCTRSRISSRWSAR